MKRLIVLAAIMALLTGCATTGTTSTDPLASQKQWVEGAMWVEAVADGIVMTACALDKMSNEKCAAYSLAKSELDRQLIVIQALIDGNATPQQVQAAIASAMIAYYKIEAAYQGKL